MGRLQEGDLGVATTSVVWLRAVMAMEHPFVAPVQ